MHELPDTLPDSCNILACSSQHTQSYSQYLNTRKKIIPSALSDIIHVHMHSNDSSDQHLFLHNTNLEIIASLEV